MFWSWSGGRERNPAAASGSANSSTTTVRGCSGGAASGAKVICFTDSSV